MIHKYKAFTSLSRRKRRARAQYIKTLIHRERHRCGGLHYDDSEPAEGHNWSWSDILFLDKDPATYWNAEIITAELARVDIVEGIVFDEAYTLLSEAEKAVEFDIERINDPSRSYPQFDGVTFSEYVRKREVEIARDTIPPVQCGYQIRPSYRDGIGLKIIVAESLLTREIIDDAIRSFLAGDMPLITTK